MQDDARRRAQAWLDPKFFDEETRRAVQRLLDSDPKGLSDAFFRDLSFGTGGMRGEMGVGTNRMNVYTIRTATQGLANYLKKQPASADGYSVFIGYDTRHHSQEFALEAARVLAGNGIGVRMTEEICPTPLVSFGCRHFRCSAAINITASHNPPQYNGYKVYWEDGAQVVPPHDLGIVEEADKIQSQSQVHLAPANSPLIQPVGSELDEAYLAQLKTLQLYPELAQTPLKIVYTPLYGTGIRILREALASWGYPEPALVEEQSVPDGDFPTAPFPNPEMPKAMELGTQKLLQTKADLFIATDPDADRLGAVALDRGKPFAFTGNQLACICLFHICSALELRGQFPPNAAFVKTIVTTELFRVIAESFGGVCIDVLTGFKYIAEQIRLWENSFDAYQYLFGAEESYGSLFGTTVRDKDAISSACLAIEAAALAKKQNITLVDRLYQIYRKYGVHRESLANLAFEESKAGMDQMANLMDGLRKHPPKKIGGVKVATIEDYERRLAETCATHQQTPLSLPRSDVLRFWLQDGTKLVIRPSGTEPKVKIYAEIVEKKTDNVDQAIRACDERLKELIASFKRDIGIA